MTPEKLVGCDDVGQGGAAVDFARGQEELRGRDQQDVVVKGRALGGDGARGLEEGGQEGVQGLHSGSCCAPRLVGRRGWCAIWHEYRTLDKQRQAAVRGGVRGSTAQLEMASMTKDARSQLSSLSKQADWWITDSTL